MEIIRKYQKNSEEFDFIFINAMQLTNPNLVYTILAQKILNKILSPCSAAQFLDSFFKSSDKQTLIYHHLGIKPPNSKKKSKTK